MFIFDIFKALGVTLVVLAGIILLPFVGVILLAVIVFMIFYYIFKDIRSEGHS